jgi:AraC-like DNA-binding protein
VQNKSWYLIEGEIEIKDIGIVDGTGKHPQRRGVDFWVLTLLQKGQRTLRSDGEEIRVSAHEFFLLPPHTRQEPLERDTHKACYVHFFAKGEAARPPERVDASKILLPKTGMLPSSVDCTAHLKELAMHALSPYADHSFLSLQLRAMLSMMSLHCQKNPNEEKQGSFAEQVLLFIQQNAYTPLRAEDYEVFFGKSYHHINLLFKKQFGCTVKHYHQRVRMEHAAQMLIQGRSVQQTAAECGFEDYFFFINSFKKAHGISPAAYGRQDRERQ